MALDALDDAVATAHHHDAITGTAKQAVANDYARRLAAGFAALQPRVAAALSAAIFGASDAPLSSSASGHVANASSVRRHHLAAEDDSSALAQQAAAARDVARVASDSRDVVASGHAGGHVQAQTTSSDTRDHNAAFFEGRPRLHHCEAANASLCAAPLEWSKGCEVMMLVAHNPVAWTRTVNVQARIRGMLCSGMGTPVAWAHAVSVQDCKLGMST
jgi:hypothetical protein